MITRTKKYSNKSRQALITNGRRPFCLQFTRVGRQKTQIPLDWMRVSLMDEEFLCSERHSAIYFNDLPWARISGKFIITLCCGWRAGEEFEIFWIPHLKLIQILLRKVHKTPLSIKLWDYEDVKFVFWIISNAHDGQDSVCRYFEVGPLHKLINRFHFQSPEGSRSAARGLCHLNLVLTLVILLIPK